MENDKNHRAVGHDHDQDFRDVERPVLCDDVVQHYVGKWPVRIPVRDTLVHHCERSRRQYKIDDHKEKRWNQQFIINTFCLGKNI